MAHKTLIGGTAYKIRGGRDLINGTGYDKKQGKTLVNGTARAISFGISLNTITPGAILYLNESGSPVPFYIAKHDYESDLNGAGRTLIVRKDCYDERAFGDSNNAYANGPLDSWLCNTYLKLLDADIQAAIGTTKFYYTPGNGNTIVTTLQRAVFQLSLTELGKSENIVNTEGSELPIARKLRIAYRNGSACAQWTRTPSTNHTNVVCCLNIDGRVRYALYDDSAGSRPAFTLSGNLEVEQNPDGSYAVAG